MQGSGQLTARRTSGGFDLQKLLASPQLRYAAGGALTSGTLSLLKSLAQNRPMRSAAGNALGSAGLGALAGLGVHGLGTAGGAKMPELRLPKTAMFIRALNARSIPATRREA